MAGRGCRLLVLLALLLPGLVGCAPESSPGASTSGSPPRLDPGPRASPATTGRYGPVSLRAVADATIGGSALSFGAVREQTQDYTSYDVTYRSRLGRGALSGPESLTISGVLTVPVGDGPFPAVVLAHGYVPPELYATRQGMVRERTELAEAGYVTLDVDYRGYGESDDDPDITRHLRLGYTVDVVAAGLALRATSDVPVDDTRLGLLGRSMGGGVAMKALVVEPDLFRAASLWGAVSSRESEVYHRFLRVDALLPEDPTPLHGTPEDNPRFWRGVSPRPFLGAVTASVELVHGRVDEVCPPRWAPATLRAMRSAGVDARLHWYPDGHAFGVWFTRAIDTTARFFDRELAVRG